MNKLQFLPSWKGIWRYITDPNAAWLPKITLVAAVIYLLFPFDLYPDIFPIIGWLDDLGLNVLAIWYVLGAAKKYEHAQKRIKTSYESKDE